MTHDPRVTKAIMALRDLDLSPIQQAELAYRMGQGEVSESKFITDDGTITIQLIGEEGKVLGEPGDFLDLLEKCIDRWVENGGPDAGVEDDFLPGTTCPTLTANVSFGG